MKISEIENVLVSASELYVSICMCGTFNYICISVCKALQRECYLNKII